MQAGLTGIASQAMNRRGAAGRRFGHRVFPLKTCRQETGQKLRWLHKNHRTLKK